MKFTTRVAAIMLVAAGYGWAGGHFIPNDAPGLAYVFQAVIILILFGFSIAFAGMQNKGAQPKSRWPIKALSVYTLLSLIINIANVIHGAVNNNPGSFGSHNTLPDLVPVTIIMAGDILWLATLLPLKQEGQ